MLSVLQVVMNNWWTSVITFTKEDMYYVILIVCLSVCLLATLCKNFERICMKFSGKVGNGPIYKWLNFGGDLDCCI